MSNFVDISGHKFGMLTPIHPSGNDSTGKTVWECDCDCGGKSLVTMLNLKSGNTKSCGCLKHRKGADNPKFIPISREDKKFKKRTYAHYRQWRNSILTRCPVCIKCGNETSLEVHHILGVYEFPINTLEPSNGLTLCHDCHIKFHVTYGRRGGFTEQDLREFTDENEEHSKIVWLVLNHQWKNGAEDIRKAIHYLQLLLEWEYKEVQP